MDELQAHDIPSIILLGTFVVLLLIGSMGVFILMYQRRILLEKQKQSLQELAYQELMIKLQFESQEQERKRIGADLHDSLGSLLWGAKVNASFIQRSVGINNNDTMASYAELNEILDESIEAVRRIAWELTPDAFHYSGLSASVMKLCERLNGRGIEITFDEQGTGSWNDDRGLHVFRIIQELISNSIKHSSATLITISLIWGDDQLNAVVEDNGQGYISDNTHKGVGLWNIEQRIKQLNGKISIGNPPIGTGVKVNLEIPLAS